MSTPRRLTLAALAVLLLGWLASGIYFVQPDERGVVRWFGKVPEGPTVPPGIHYALPWPFAKVDRPKTTEVRRVYVGLLPEERAAIARGAREALLASPESDMLTGDVNILKTTMVVQFQVSDPTRYLFATTAPEALVHSTVQAVLIETLAGMPVDQALTGAKTALQFETKTRAQELLDRYDSGVRLVATHLETVEPPRAIVEAFQEVVSAKKDGERATSQADTEAGRMLSRARGEAVRILKEAESYQQALLAEARGEADRFLAVLEAHREHPELFEQRLLIETLEEVLPNIRTYVLDESGDAPSKVRIVGQK